MFNPQNWRMASLGWLTHSNTFKRDKLILQNFIRHLSWLYSIFYSRYFIFTMTPLVCDTPANTRRWPNVCWMLGHRRRRWTNIKPTLGQHLVFAGTNHCRPRAHVAAIIKPAQHAKRQITSNRSTTTRYSPYAGLTLYRRLRRRLNVNPT